MMTKDYHESPSSVEQPSLPPQVETWPLSQRVQTWREMRGWSVPEFSARCGLAVQTIEEVEAGLERVISTLVRKRLAKGLQVPSNWLKAEPGELETLLKTTTPNNAGLMTLNQVVSIYQERLPLEAMLANPDGNWPCPECGAMLYVQGYPRESIEGELLTLVRLNCSDCLFRLEEETHAHYPDI